MGRLIKPVGRSLIGGPAGAVTGLGGLTVTGGSLLGVPKWMRAGVAGTLAGWFTPTATIPNLGRLFHFANASGTDHLECYAEPGSSRWQYIATSASVARATAFITRTPQASGVMLGFAFTWSGSRINGAIGTTLGASAPYGATPLPPVAPVNLYAGNRADGARTLPANYWGLEFLDFTVSDAVLLELAGRARPTAQAPAA